MTTKKTILSALFFSLAFFCKAQFAYISTDGFIILESGSIESYDTPDIFVDGCYSTVLGAWNITLKLTAPGASTGNYVKIYQTQFTKATVDAFTPGTATGETETIQNVVLQAVKAYIEGLNGGITCTLH